MAFAWPAHPQKPPLNRHKPKYTHRPGRSAAAKTDRLSATLTSTSADQSIDEVLFGSAFDGLQRFVYSEARDLKPQKQDQQQDNHPEGYPIVEWGRLETVGAGFGSKTQRVVA
ncbi:hypothetical protein [Martelella limonii]|uniref:hypothetical protein n=1 Tax=Martelella limonii TaxID=1647649 RepID=UPI00157FECED|nr:hypothetical protein [Martelella limonii]